MKHASLLILCLWLSAAGWLSAQDAGQQVIDAEDLVLIKVFEEDDLETTARVAENGRITFPLLGAVQIGGKTASEAAGMIREGLRAGYIRNPQVTLTVMEHSKRRFTVLGQVQQPGAYEMPDRRKVTILEAIGMAGGFTDVADEKNVVLKRSNGGKEQIFKINAKEMAKGGAAGTFEVLPGDVISVGESWL